MWPSGKSTLSPMGTEVARVPREDSVEPEGATALGTLAAPSATPSLL